MIEIPVYSPDGEQISSVQVDEQKLGGRVRPELLKQAYVRTHANRRVGTAATKSRGQVEGSTRKLYRQKGTGNARRGDKKANILRGGGHAKAKRPHSWRQKMPNKMRQLANRNALLAKAVDGEIKLISSLKFDNPSTKQFANILSAMQIDRSCLLALPSTQGAEAKSAGNLENITLTGVDRLNAFDLLSHRYLLMEQQSLENYLNNQTN